jgi:small subunit ribosomal protein S15
MLDKAKKDAIIKKFKVHDSDTGSSEVQIAILSEEIRELTEHLKIHKKDFSSRRGLLRKVSLRRRLLKFLSKDNPESYENLAKKLKLKKFAEPEREVKILEEGAEEEPADL